MQASTGAAVGSTVPLRPPAAAVRDEGGAVLAIERMLAAPPLCPPPNPPPSPKPKPKPAQA